MLKEIKKGFTLAEVLIVIGIIGVVAALTLPNLNHATGDKETVTRVKKAYSILSEATDRVIANYGSIDEWSLEKCNAESLDICWMNRIKDFLKISKSCNELVDSASDYNVNCGSFAAGDFGYDGIIFQLPDGLTIGTTGYSDCNNELNWAGTKRKMCSLIYIDINGPQKGKNKASEDVFGFDLVADGIFPAFEGDYETESDFIEDCVKWKVLDCTYWVINYDNLDYLKTDNTGKCPNGVQLSETQTSCN